MDPPGVRGASSEFSQHEGVSRVLTIHPFCRLTHGGFWTPSLSVAVRKPSHVNANDMPCCIVRH